MHEFSIVQSMLDLCEDKAKEESAKRVLEIEVKIGILSGVEPELLKSAFDTFKDKTICKEAKLELNIQNVLIKCRSCKRESELKKMEFKCPECKSVDIEILDGEDMYLMSLTME